MVIDTEPTREEVMRRVAKDETIFRPDGVIVFPRSDGDAQHRPEGKNFEPPAEGEKYYNYYHLCESDDDKWLISFKQRVGFKLAELFQLPKDRDWTIKDLPENYLLTMNFLLDPRRHHSVRQDRYLYGCKGAIFRSAPEFACHAQNLLCDPQMRRSKCMCKYCKGGSSWRVETADLSTKAHLPAVRKTTGERRLQSRRTSRKIEDSSYHIRAQQSSEGQILPDVPASLAEDLSRELAMAGTESQGAFEGFRRGELVFYLFEEPIPCPRGGHKADVRLWPVHIIQETSRSTVDDQQMSSGEEEDSSSDERHIKKTRSYAIKFLGTQEDVIVDETQLTPALAAELPDVSSWKSMVDMTDVDGTQGKADLNLVNAKRRASWDMIAPVFITQIYYIQALRSLYTLTHPFSRQDWSHLPPQSTSSGVVRGMAVNAGSDDDMELDEDQGAHRPRQTSSHPAPVSPSTETGTNLINDTNQYWQGMYLGSERIWVGEVVRLCLRITDAKLMFAVLKESNKLNVRDDRKSPRVDCPFVLRIKAIYRAAGAEATDLDDKIRVAGDVFRVLNCKEYARQHRERQHELLQLQKQQSAQENKSHASRRGSLAKASRQPEVHSRPPIPLRSSLDASQDSQTPSSPHLPHGYGFQRVNQKCVEVVFSVQHIAGRLYPSLECDQKVGLQSLNLARFVKATVDDDSLYSRADRLHSLSGLLPGFVRNMAVRTKRGQAPSQRAMFHIASRKARESMSKEFPQEKRSTKEVVRSESEPTVSDEGCEINESSERDDDRASNGSFSPSPSQHSSS